MKRSSSVRSRYGFEKRPPEHLLRHGFLGRTRFGKAVPALGGLDSVENGVDRRERVAVDGPGAASVLVLVHLADLIAKLLFPLVIGSATSSATSLATAAATMNSMNGELMDFAAMAFISLTFSTCSFNWSLVRASDGRGRRSP